MSNAQLTDFHKNLSHKPYCSDDLMYGLKIRSKKVAILMPYIQGNQPCMIHYLFFDIDRLEAAMAWHDAELPRPYWITQNKKNGHSHLCYKLKIPLCTSDLGSKKAISYAARIQAGLSKKLGADVAYSHLITKNPFHTDWRTTFWTDEAYTLDYLAGFVDLSEKLSRKQEVSGLGRNCTMFDMTRKWAYKAIREHGSGTYNSWYEDVLKRCISSNQAFLEPLPYSEIKATAKSIAGWVWKNHAQAHKKFIKRQTEKGQKGGLKSDSSHGGLARSLKYSDLRNEALKLNLAGTKQIDIAEQLKVSTRTIRSWLKPRNHSIS